MTIQELLALTIGRKASDLHIIPDYPPTLRINGELLPLVSYQAVTNEAVEALFLPILTSEQKESLHLNREIDFGLNYENHRFRVNLYYTSGALGGSFRLIPERILTLEELGLPAKLHDLILDRQGFILVTGPTGEGKSTTLASLLNEINTKFSKHILTIEDPIEYVYPPLKSVVSQREVGQDTHNWNIALRSALREDPDVVLIGEMRDYETIQAALTIAETGHLVFSTVHTNSAAQTIDRILDVFPSHQQAQIRIQLASVLKAVVCQRLVPTMQNGTRVPVCEILINTPAIAAIIREGKTHLIDNVIQTSSNDGMLYFENHLATLYQKGIISKDTAMAYAIRQKEILRLIGM